MMITAIKRLPFRTLLLTYTTLFWFGCKQDSSSTATQEKSEEVVNPSSDMFGLYDFAQAPQDGVDSLLAKYTPFTLTTDVAALTENEKEIIFFVFSEGCDIGC